MRSKSEIRKEVWSEMEEEGVARFPTPIEGRIPNFVGAEEAAEKLDEVPEFLEAERVKVNPDSPQNWVRAKVIEKGKVLFMPTPRLREGFLRISPEDVPEGDEKKATTIKHSGRYGEKIELEEMEGIDLVVGGSVAVSKNGKRVGKGGGYSDLEYAILRELNLGKPAVLTTVHPIQLYSDLPQENHDVPLDWIVTSEQVIETKTDLEKPSGIHWELLSEEDLKEMPVLKELKELS